MSTARTLFCSILLLACGDKSTEDSGATAPSGPGFSLMTDDVPGGVLLGAWSDGDTALMVGGPPLGGPAMLARYDGDTLCVESDVAEHTLWWIHGPQAGEWYAVGEAGTVVHSVDGVRTREDLPTDVTLYGVYADGVDVWAVGGSFGGDGDVGEIWRRTDGAWSLFAGDLPAVVFKVWEGWFVGQGVAYRRDEDTVKELDTGGARLVTIRGRDPYLDVWAVGGTTSPVLMHNDGSTLGELGETPFTQPLNGVWTAMGESVWVAGNYGAVGALHDDGTWQLPDALLTQDHLHAAWGHGDEVLFVGGNLLAGGDFHGTILRYGDDLDPIGVTECP